MSESKCPLCQKERATEHDSKIKEKSVTVFKCPMCKTLVLEEGIEDELYSFLQQTRDKMIDKAKNMTGNQFLYFFWDHSIQNAETKKPHISMQIMDSSYL